jgi:hypothetical protein
MNWDQFEAELRAQKDAAEAKLALFLAARRLATGLQGQNRALRKYIEELEKVLEPHVIAEIRAELEEDQRWQANLSAPNHE